jgi:toxin ParE1/3/4
MSYHVIFSQRAVKDIDTITDFIALDNLPKALAFAEELYKRGYSLNNFPQRFQSVRGLKRIVHGNYIIFYRINEKAKEVVIISVTHGRRIK